MANNPYQPGQVILVTSTGPIQSQIMPLGGGWAGGAAGAGGAAAGYGNYGQYGGGGAGYGTASFGGYSGSYNPPPIDPTAQQRHVARYDGIMEGYWLALLEGFTFRWASSDNSVYSQAQGLVRLLRYPAVDTAIQMSDRQIRVQDEMDELVREMEEAAYGRQFQAALGQQQNTWGDVALNQATQTFGQYIGGMARKVFGGNTA